MTIIALNNNNNKSKISSFTKRRYPLCDVRVLSSYISAFAALFFVASQVKVIKFSYAYKQTYRCTVNLMHAYVYLYMRGYAGLLEILSGQTNGGNYSKPQTQIRIRYFVGCVLAKA
uniref:Uncharacterized protein n=1 Tax=Glossina pallidipes TaxID=7398 RepID=A0A1B0A707_GLOPL